MTKTYRTQSLVAGVLFVLATSTTMAAQVLLDPFLQSTDVASAISHSRISFMMATILEVTNALASAGIAIALFPIIWTCTQGMAVAYIGLRILEAGMGLLAACALLVLLSPIDAQIGIAFHKWGFLLVLFIFSIGTLVFYPTLYRYQIVPSFISIWGLVGGAMLLVSCVLIFFDKNQMGSNLDIYLSLPIWINEMVLAAWLIFRGVDMSTEVS